MTGVAYVPVKTRVREGFTIFDPTAGATAPLPPPALPPASRSVHGDGRFLHGNLGELMASSTESGLGCCCSTPGSLGCCGVGGDGDGDGDCSSRLNIHLAGPLPGGGVPAAAASSSHRRRWCRQLSAPADLGMPATSGTGEWTARSCCNSSPDLILR